MGDWKIIGSAGSVTATAAPNAPNITSVSVSAYYGMRWNGSAFGCQGTITLPTGDAAYSHLKQINISATLADGSVQDVGTLYAAFSGSTVTFKGPCTLPQTGSSISVTLTFTCLNDDGVATASPVTATVTAQASSVTGFTSAAEVGTRYVAPSDASTRLVSMTTGFVPILNGGQVPQNVSYLLSKDNGANFNWCGWSKINNVGDQITIPCLAPGTAGTWKVAAYAGVLDGSGSPDGLGGLVISAANLATRFPGAVISSGFSVSGLAAPAAGVVTSISAGTITSHVDKTTGWQWAELDGVNWTDPTDNSWLVKFYVRETDVSGTPASDSKGTWREWFEKQVTGGARTSIASNVGPLQITYRAASDTHHYLQIQCVAVNRLSTNPGDWAGTNTASSVAQGSVIQVDFSTLPTGKLNLSMADPATTLPGIQVIDVPAPNPSGMAVAVTITSGSPTPAGVQTFGWEGTVTLPTSLTNYAGCAITAQYAGSAEGGVFATLSPTQTTFHNGFYPRPTTAINVTFRAYPISRDLQRGTPVSVTVSVGAAGTATLDLGQTLPSSVGHGVVVGSDGKPKLNTSNLSNLMLNGDFANGLTGWTQGAGWSIYTYGGVNWATTNGAGTFIHQDVSCRAGDQFHAEIDYFCSPALLGSAVINIYFLDAAGTLVTQPMVLGAATGTLTRLKLDATAPATAVTARFYFGTYPGSTSGWLFDTAVVTRQIPTGPGMIPDGNGGVKTGTSSNPANMLSNASFEDGIAGWKEYGLTGWTSYGAGYTGTKSALSPGPNAFLYQDFTCVPGDGFYAEVYYSSSAATGSFNISYWYLDATGAPVGSGSQFGAVLSGWTKLALQLPTAPSGASSVRIFFGEYPGSTGSWVMDNAWFSRQTPTGPGMVPDGNGGVRAVQQGSNLIDNPDFEQGTQGWTLSDNGLGMHFQSDASVSHTLPGVRCLEINSLVNGAAAYASQTKRVIGGRTYSFYVWTATDAGDQFSDQIVMYWFDASGALISAAVVGGGGPPIALSGWTKRGGIATAPSGAVVCNFQINLNCHGGTGNIHYDDAEAYLLPATGLGTSLDSSGGVQAKLLSGSPLSVDGSGNLIVKQGAGVGTDGSGNLVVKTSSTIGTDGSGNVIIPALAVQTSNLAAGSLGDLSKYSSTVRAVTIVYSLPSLPQAAYPTGAVIMNTADGKVYRTTNGTTWDTKSAPADLFTGTLASGVVYAGTVAAANVVAGSLYGFTISGSSLTIIAGSKTIYIDATNSVKIVDSAYGRTIQLDGANGLYCYQTATPAVMTQVLPDSVYLADGTGAYLTMSHSQITINDGHGNSVSIFPNGIQKNGTSYTNP